MKRVVNEKNSGIMFPRIHVNDTEKGGPRAPPRNKMALYEQFSMPSQRLSSEEGVSERGSFSRHQQTPTMHTVDETNNRYSELNTKLNPKKKQEHEDFSVPIIVQQSGTNLDHSGNHQRKDNETFSHYNFPFSDCLTNVKKSSERNKIQLKETNSSSSFGHRNVSNTNSISGCSRDHVIDSVDHDVRELKRSCIDHINGENASESSMVDSMSGASFSPDDVVGVIGLKLFWKARRAIVNQQRVFAVQVFELHRLIKVQRLIAGLPQLMIETDMFVGKPTKASHIKPTPLDDILRKSSTNVPKVKNYHENSKDNKTAFSAENVTPHDPRMGPWSQQPGQQWLIPVMSPSEGLIYKPYPASGYTTPGPGPPPGHNFLNHGASPRPQPYYQWPMFQPAYGYFPPYGMTTSGNERNPSPSNMLYPNAVNFHGSNSEAQVSTASSPYSQPKNPPANEPTRAIRVVPRNARLATESVARIFRSIQEERKQQDPV